MVRWYFRPKAPGDTIRDLEAHTAAPSTASKCANDSRIIRVIRDVAPRFENRLLLLGDPPQRPLKTVTRRSSSSSIPQRFSRGVDVTDPKQLQPVMVRASKKNCGSPVSKAIPHQ